MDNGEKHRISAEPDKFIESNRVFPEFEPMPEKFTEPNIKVQTSFDFESVKVEGDTISFVRSSPPDKFTGL